MPIELYKEKWSDVINVVTIGTEDTKVNIGGQTTLPFLFQEGDIPNRPVVAMEIWDIVPADWPDSLVEAFKDCWKDPIAWAKICQDKYKADLICLKLQGAHPDTGNKTPDELAKIAKSISDNIKIPLIILGSGDDLKDNEVLPIVAEALKGKNCLFGDAVQENYKTLAASCLADGHSIIAESPIDINIAKQLNILITDMGFPANKIIINPTVGALGYGLEYTYSIMERARLAALMGDKMMAMPFICFVGQEAWRAKEAKATLVEFPQWGDEKERGPLWESMTATAFLQSGADILVMRHPKAVNKVRKIIDELMKH